jgi:hypothetical protein
LFSFCFGPVAQSYPNVPLSSMLRRLLLSLA